MSNHKNTITQIGNFMVTFSLESSIMVGNIRLICMQQAIHFSQPFENRGRHTQGKMHFLVS